MAIGDISHPVAVKSVLAAARSDASRMGDLVLHARNIANGVISGWHGKRRQGTGDNFWQFRPYYNGESAARIDWRRSARDTTLYIRDREWEAAQTVFLWPDLSPSMRYQSRFAMHSKEMRAILLTLILGEVFAHNGERIALPGLMEPTSARNGAERIAHALTLGEKAMQTLDFASISRYAHVVVISDFLDEMSELETRLAKLAEHNVRAHLIEIADPAEALFPYAGHVVFRDPEDGLELDAGRAESYREDYCRLYQARRTGLSDICRRYGWTFTRSQTDRPITETLTHINLAIVASGSERRGTFA